LARRVAFGMDVGDFLQLERAFERDRVRRAAAEIEHIAAMRERMRKRLDARLERECLGHQARNLDQRTDQLALVILGEDAARTPGVDGEAAERRKLARESLGRRDT